mgnify:CR=1 FL=1
MELNLKNKKVLITGSTRGIGKAIAKEFSYYGSKVVLNSRDKSDLIETSKSIPYSSWVQADVTKALEAKYLVKKTIELMDNIDILICNVGSGNSAKPGKEEIRDWEEMFSVNFYSAVNVIDAAKECLIKSKGVIICISSICGSNYIKDAPITYSTSKAALNSYIKLSAKLFGKFGVRINGIAPGNIIFEGSVWDKKIKENSSKVKNFLHEDVPLSRLGKPIEIAKLACFLASEVSSFATGDIWRIDGGQSF